MIEGIEEIFTEVEIFELNNFIMDYFIVSFQRKGFYIVKKAHGELSEQEVLWCVGSMKYVK